MKVRLYKGLWTLFDGERPVMSFANMWDAIEARDEAMKELHQRFSEYQSAMREDRSMCDNESSDADGKRTRSESWAFVGSILFALLLTAILVWLDVL